MSHEFTFVVTVTVDRVSGKFASRDEMAEPMIAALTEAIGSVDLTGLGVDCESEYTVVDSEVVEQ